MEVVLGFFQEIKLTKKPSKNKFVQVHIIFLGQEAGSQKKSLNGAKIQAIKDFLTLNSKMQVCNYDEMVEY